MGVTSYRVTSHRPPLCQGVRPCSRRQVHLYFTIVGDNANVTSYRLDDVTLIIPGRELAARTIRFETWWSFVTELRSPLRRNWHESGFATGSSVA